MHTPFRRYVAWLMLAFAIFMSAGTGIAADDQRSAIDWLLDDFHQAAADADRDRYLGHFAPDGVFMATDDWERWPLADFIPYVEQRFAGGTGWSYLPEQRFVSFAPQGNIAWFDEVVVSERWGRFRGTGVLRQIDGQWKIAHYSLTALVPNERFADVARINREGFRERTSPNQD
jgi:ketosteroid isomerase-like protein